jgi:transcription elongation GreA/GreB family factor
VALREAIEALRAMPLGDFRGRRAALGALATLEDDDGETRVVWLVPDGAGGALEGGLRAVSVTTPLGRALVGRSEGDAVEAPRGGAQVTYTLASLV